jgi:hypothetical protein
MKLTKNELLFLLDSIDPKKWEAENLSGFVRRAIYNNHLDIEGYERGGWIKFDPDDPKTFPPKNTVVLLTVQGLPLEENIHTWHTYLQERHNAQGLPGIFTHWRHLPQPPVE